MTNYSLENKKAWRDHFDKLVEKSKFENVQQLAEAAGLSPATVYNLRSASRGERNSDSIRMITDALGINTGGFLDQMRGILEGVDEIEEVDPLPLVVSDRGTQFQGVPYQPITSEELIDQVNKVMNMHREGDVGGYRTFVSRSKISNNLKRAALFEKLRDLAAVDLGMSLRTGYAQSLLTYMQSCLVLCEIESAIDVAHRKLSTDHWLDTYSIANKAAFLRTYAEILSAAGRADLSVLLLENFLNSGWVRELRYSHFSHILSTLGESYLAIGNLAEAYSIAQENYDEQSTTRNDYGLAIAGTRLGIVLLARNKAGDAIPFFEAASTTFEEFDLRACAWAKLYCHICALRLGEERINHLDSAMDFYAKFGHASKELVELMQEAQTADIGWCQAYDEVFSRISDRIAKCEISGDKLHSAEKFCSALTARPASPGANAINHKVSRGEFRQNSNLTSSFLYSLNEEAKNEYLDEIVSTERFYLRPFYNRVFRHLTKRKPDIIKRIIFPRLKEISQTRDSFRVYYARILERHAFIKEADFLLDSVDDKTQFRYLNNKANILTHRRATLDNALQHYKMAVEATENDQEKSIAYHNQALAILQKRVKSKYEEAEALCRLSLKHRVNEAFSSPLQTLLLLQIDKESRSKTGDVLVRFQEEFCLNTHRLRKMINQIRDRRKQVEAEKFLLSSR